MAKKIRTLDCRINDLITEIYRIHDVEFQQKYGDVLPYSQHLIWVGQHVNKFKHYLAEYDNVLSRTAVIAAAGHDLLEDTNYTYNDLLKKFKEYLDNKTLAEASVEVIYRLTDEKGRNRKERKNAKYYQELRESEVAIFVKLCDIAVNTLFSKLNNSRMYSLYKKEFSSVKEKMYNSEFKNLDNLFNYVENL